MQSIQNQLERIRKPRVHIKYEVETESGVIEKELPFVVGVLGDFSGSNLEQRNKPLKDRKFIQIDRDNIDQVMQRLTPELNLSVDNLLDNTNSKFSVNLKFNKMEDFEPARLVEQVPELKALMHIRKQLKELLSRTDRSDALEALLEQVLQDPLKLKQLAAELDSKH